MDILDSMTGDISAVPSLISLQYVSPYQCPQFVSLRLLGVLMQQWVCLNENKHQPYFFIMIDHTVYIMIHTYIGYNYVYKGYSFVFILKTTNSI